jgi:TatA/E family protein of Tat protein translocase
MLGTLGGPEIILILVLALIVFGPRKLPEVGKSMGKMLAEFRKASNDFKRTIEDEVEAEKAREASEASPAPARLEEAASPTEASGEMPAFPLGAPSDPTVARGASAQDSGTPEDPPPTPPEPK